MQQKLQNQALVEFIIEDDQHRRSRFYNTETPFDNNINFDNINFDELLENEFDNNSSENYNIIVKKVKAALYKALQYY
ncbi:17671_t:CDS:2 [Cetraspora pellucida]|uniref:17671_t:CDS:1 n=1 Tax=Cetraspora pellucida TaxID=1433469 RepID=A0ACA9KYL3_9GLOM|nr:17671_t:CDS:2 [Cetraspora pellucida]